MRILIVDDNDVNLSILAQMLDKLGFDVTRVQSAAAGLKIFRTLKFELIMLDYHMPEMTGAQLATAIRFFEFQNRLPPTAVIATSVDYSQSIKTILRASGTNRFLNKPHSLTELHDAIYHCLEEQSVAI
jgi:CheY-like chemotaxis protein